MSIRKWTSLEATTGPTTTRKVEEFMQARRVADEVKDALFNDYKPIH